MHQTAYTRALRLVGTVALVLSSLNFSAQSAQAAGELITISDATVNGQAPACVGTTTATFTVSMQPASASPVTVQFTTVDDTAVQPADYLLTALGVTFNPGETVKNVPVTVNCNAVGAADGRFKVALSGATGGAVISDAEGIGTILGDVPLITIEPASVAEGNAGQTALSFTVRLSRAVAGTVTVDYATGAAPVAAGTAATPATDFVTVVAGLPNGQVTIGAGATTGTATVQIIGDTLIEGNEVFQVTLSNPVNGGLTTGPQPFNNGISAIGTIVDDESAPTLSISCPSSIAPEGSTLSCNVILSPASTLAVTVNVSTLDGTAASSGPAVDFGAVPSTLLTFAPGVTSQPIQVIPINSDALDELDETFSIVLSTATNAVIGTPSLVITITDQTASPPIRIDDGSAVEGNSGTTAIAFNISLVGGATSLQPITVNYSTAALVAADAATPGSGLGAGVDFLSSSDSVIIPPGANSTIITVLVAGDLLDEVNERFSITIDSTVPSTSINRATAIGTIIDDDLPPTLTISNVSVTEPDTGTVQAVFVVTLSQASGKPISVNFATADNSATAPADYAAATGTLNFAAGSLIQNIPVNIAGDTISENNETFFVNLTGGVNVTVPVSTRGTGTIIDNDSGPTISVDDLTVTEGDTGVAVALVTLRLSSASGRTVSVSYATVDGSAQSNDTAGAIPSTGDYTKLSASTIDFAPGVTSVQVPIEIRGDLVDEDDETFDILLSAPINGTISDPTGTITIVDNDAPPIVSIGDATTPSEGNTGQSTSAVFVINLSAASGRLVSVVFTTNNGTATAGSDYVADSRTVTFEPGATTQTVSVAVIGDLIDEPNENFTATLSTPVNATLGRKTGTATIFDDDGATVSISDATLREPTAGNSATATFTVTVSGATSFPVTVMYSTVDGTATAGSDYVARTNQSLVFTSNASQTVSITVNDDSLIEGNEDFFVNLNSVSGGGVAIGDNQGRGLISEISPLLSLSLSCPITVNEGNSGNISLNCQVTLSAQSAITVTVDYSTSNGTATAPSDYISAVGKLTFAPGSTSKNVLLAVKGDVQTESDEAFTIRLSDVQVQQMIILTVVGDKLQEGNESFSLKLLNPIGASLSGSSQSIITIIDDDSVPPRYLYLPLVRKSANSAGTLPPFNAR